MAPCVSGRHCITMTRYCWSSFAPSSICPEPQVQACMSWLLLRSLQLWLPMEGNVRLSHMQMDDRQRWKCLVSDPSGHSIKHSIDQALSSPHSELRPCWRIVPFLVWCLHIPQVCMPFTRVAKCCHQHPRSREDQRALCHACIRTIREAVYNYKTQRWMSRHMEPGLVCRQFPTPTRAPRQSGMPLYSFSSEHARWIAVSSVFPSKTQLIPLVCVVTVPWRACACGLCGLCLLDCSPWPDE
ncbi:uncharacterized protein B0I36DRAFT_91222 [Microdochium trichocladiopsis]|uniref:Uncharacterized protein n=1 Tax=Microdochium trichocladiopsis TaxID=1682393 RepID=A0A9P9BQX1_9PEZI|nr:uncharacterized protein B0I36DRAFT_91222 [Microdochium trichocladiopsis]KAH7035338.1 hypothetical protein B0I36DRAFT_91222 [Microdochium trichocladiopsis]